MLRLHKREVGGLPMAQVEGHCGMYLPIAATREEAEHQIQEARDFGAFGRRETENLLDQIKTMRLTTSFNGLRGLLICERHLQVEQAAYYPDEVGGHIEMFGGGRLHHDTILTARHGIDLLWWHQHRGDLPNATVVRAIMQQMIHAGLTNSYPAAWRAKHGGLSEEYRVALLGEIQIRISNGIDVYRA